MNDAAMPKGDAPPRRLSVDDVSLRSLHEKERIELRTADGWTLVLTRYRPVRQSFPQPIFGQPILLVHGFAQNRRAWSSGELLKNLLFFGADLFLLELRGHGKSSVSLQRRRARLSGVPLPDDIDFDWDIDSYFLYDIPAAVSKVRQVTGHGRIFYCGHSMGGILGYGYAGIHQNDLAGLIAIGAPSDLGRGFWPLRVAARAPAALPAVDSALWAASKARLGAWRALSEARALASRAGVSRVVPDPGPRPEPWRWRMVPVDSLLHGLERVLTDRRYARLTRIAPYLTVLVNPERATVEDVRWLLREGSDREPRKVVEQFARWIRHDELKCYRTGYDFRRSFKKITIPLAVIFGDRDWLAGVAETRSIYYGVKSEFLLWRPVRGNSHVELTMGHDIRQLSYDIKNLVEYAVTHEKRPPVLPRRGS